MCIRDRLSTVTVVNSVFTNSAAQFGAGVYAAGVVVVSNSHIVGNVVAKQGGGVYVRAGARFSAYNTVIRDNSAAQEGGGIYANSYTEVSGSVVHNNTSALQGGGVYAVTGVVVRIANTTLTLNSATQNGGAAGFDGADVLLRDSLVAGNIATSSGGGISASGGSVVVISNVTFTGNVAQFGAGGAIRSNNDVLRVVESSIGSVASPNVASFGCGLYANLSEVLLRNVVIEGNTGQWSFAGGAYIQSSAPLWVSNVIVRHNQSNSAGGLGIGANGGLQAYHLQLISNYASGGGAGFVSAQLSLTVDTLRVVGNTSEFGSAGLSINLWGATGLVRRAVFRYNKSTQGSGAGGFAGSGNELLTVEDLVVADNSGDADGNGVGNTGGLELWGLHLHVRPVSAPVEIVRNKGGQVGGVYGNSGKVYFHAPTPALPVIIAENTASLTSGVGGVFYSAGFYGGTAYFLGAVHVISNRGYHGGVVVTNDQFYWQSNLAYVVAVPSNGHVARIAFNRSEGPGGGLFVYGEGTAVRLDGTRLEKNFVGFISPGGGGAAVVDGGQARFINTYIADNFSSNFAGGVAAEGNGSLIVFDANFASAPPSHLPPTRVLNNYAHLSGGGVYAGSGSTLLLDNTIVASNRAANGSGGGVLIQAASAQLRNAVVAHNRGNNKGYGIGVVSSPSFQLINATVAHNHTNGIWVLNTPASVIQNTIVWGHGGAGYEFEEAPSPSTLAHCTVQGGYPGTLVLTSDPLFWNPANLDYQLSPGSLNIDTGLTTAVSTDAIGTTRPQLAAYDIGAYEFVPEPAGLLVVAAAALLLRRRS
ncbi:MAG: right-handed parallel beta-helix repeat-containing protein, partial [bacterium]|nr:right-handed parallel beta-helix repeat-containing protein [bacterium]